jgi:hypothetical protein
MGRKTGKLKSRSTENRPAIMMMMMMVVVCFLTSRRICESCAYVFVVQQETSEVSDEP